MAVQNRVGGKSNKNGVAVTRILGGGFSLGLEKPYYVDVDVNGVEEKKTFPEIIEKGYGIYGASGFFVGWSDVKFNPGVHAKAAMRFDYGRFNEVVTAIETGLMAEFYTSQYHKTHRGETVFFNAYVSLRGAKVMYFCLLAQNSRIKQGRKITLNHFAIAYTYQD
jgi:hypothetical protein